MRDAQLVTVVRVGAKGLTVVSPDGRTTNYAVKGAVVNVLVGSNLSGDYRVLRKRATLPLETKA